MLRNDISHAIDTAVRGVEPRMIEIRRDIHAHPETGFDTVRTAALVAEELRRVGLEPKTGIGRTGVVAEITGAKPGPCLLLRADMDALPIQEETGLPFASTIPGKMHACGHDMHTATLLGAAEVLAGMKDQLSGTIRLVFQPAEETLESGAQEMVAEGAADGADMAIAFHNRPEDPVGTFTFLRGASTASSDEFDVMVRGRSGHAARPHAAQDPIVAAAFMVGQLQTVISREMNPAQSAVLTIGAIRGGETHNIIPDSCMFRGTVRARSPEARDHAEAAFRRICEGAAAAMNVVAEIAYVRGVPPLMNDDAMIDRMAGMLTEQTGTAPRIQQGTSFGAEDFSHFSERMPSVHLQVGSGQPGRQDRVHNSDYQPDEGCLAQGAIALVRASLGLLA